MKKKTLNTGDNGDKPPLDSSLIDTVVSNKSIVTISSTDYNSLKIQVQSHLYLNCHLVTPLHQIPLSQKKASCAIRNCLLMESVNGLLHILCNKNVELSENAGTLLKTQKN